MKLSFKNRIALNYLVATALIMALVYFGIFISVQQTVIHNLDKDLSFEALKHIGEVNINGDSIFFRNKSEWEEKEHLEIQVNPVFIQLIDQNGKIMDKSPNLKESALPFEAIQSNSHFDAFLNERSIRQVQRPIKVRGEIKGYILAAMSSESEELVILKLRNVLLISYFFVLVVLYLASQYLAGKSIKPVQNLTGSISKIQRNNLSQRVQLPPNKDEIYDLSANFNQLLERIEKAMKRERQFTSDASHELRTPLAALRGTLEVLIRKPRSHEEYQKKVKYALNHVDQMTQTLEQLLSLARLDSASSQKVQVNDLSSIVQKSLKKYSLEIQAKELSVDFQTDTPNSFKVPENNAKLILDNVISNAIKYSHSKGLITIHLNSNLLTIKDQGIGIKSEELPLIYDSFFRSEEAKDAKITGNGLGLSIARKSAETIQAELSIESEYEKGTLVNLAFKKIITFAN